MPQNVEIERKYLVKRPPPGWKRRKSAQIVQGYLTADGSEVEVRLRRKGGQHYITIKGGHGQRRLEEELEIPETRFKRLWSLTRNARISKRRYEIPLNGRTIEMDVYAGRHRGLITAEIEFDSSNDCRRFQSPEWFEKEITGQRRFTNAALARRRGVATLKQS